MTSSNRKIVQDALKISEMDYALECICTDDRKDPNDSFYSDNWYVDEAMYRLSTYFEDGHINNDEMRLGEDASDRAVARKDIKMLRAFIKKYRTPEMKFHWLEECKKHL